MGVDWGDKPWERKWVCDRGREREGSRKKERGREKERREGGGGRKVINMWGRLGELQVMQEYDELKRRG